MEPYRQEIGNQAFLVATSGGAPRTPKDNKEYNMRATQ